MCIRDSCFYYAPASVFGLTEANAKDVMGAPNDEQQLKLQSQPAYYQMKKQLVTMALLQLGLNIIIGFVVAGTLSADNSWITAAVLDAVVAIIFIFVCILFVGLYRRCLLYTSSVQ